VASLDFKFWTNIALKLWDDIPALTINDIPLLVGVRFTRTIKSEDMNLQLFDLDWEIKSSKSKYEVPDRISFGDPGRMFGV
jgi:hypothetical protein